MVLNILDQNMVPVRAFDDYTDLCITKTIAPDGKTLEFATTSELLISNVYTSYTYEVETEYFIETDEDLYTIKEINHDSDGKISIFCKRSLDDLEGRTFVLFETVEKTLTQAMTTLLSGTGWTFTVASGITKQRTLRMENCNIIDVIKQALNTYNVECEINARNKTISFVEAIGQDRGSHCFTTDVNLRKLSVSNDTYDFYTEIEAYGKDGLEMSSGARDSDGRRYISDYTYSTKKKRFIWKDERYTVASHLYEDAVIKLEQLCQPKMSYAIDIIDLYRMQMSGYTYSEYQFDIGDVITIVDDETKTSVKQRITQMTIYPDDPGKNKCVISNIVPNVEDILTSSAKTLSHVSETVQRIENTDFVARNVPVTMSSATVAGGDGLFIRKWGKVVTITGSVKMAATGNDQIVASFLSGDAPTRATFVSCTAGGASTQSACYITTSGTVCVNAFTTDTLRIHGVWITS